MNKEEFTSRLDAAKTSYKEVFDAVSSAADKIATLETKATADRLGPVAIKEARQAEIARALKAVEPHLEAMNGLKGVIESTGELFDARTALAKAADMPLASWNPLPENDLSLMQSERSANRSTNLLGGLLAANLNATEAAREESRLQRMTTRRLIAELHDATNAADLRRAGVVCKEAGFRELSAGEQAEVEGVIAKINEFPTFQEARKFKDGVETFISEARLVMESIGSSRIPTYRTMMRQHLMGEAVTGSGS